MSNPLTINTQKIYDHIRSSVSALMMPNLELLKGLFLAKKQIHEAQKNALLRAQGQAITRAQQAALSIYYRHHPNHQALPNDYQGVVNYLAKRT